MEAGVADELGKAGIGEKYLARLARTRLSGVHKRQQAATARHERWRNEAINIWKARPYLTATACAKAVATKIDPEANPRTISKAIGNLRPKKETILKQR